MINVILFSGHITDQVREQFEERSLIWKIAIVIAAGVAIQELVEYIQYGLNGVLQVQAAVVGSDCFIWNNYQLCIVLDVVGIEAVVHLRVRLAYFLHRVLQAAREENFYLVLRFVEHLF